MPSISSGIVDADELEDRRQHVDRVRELAPRAAAVGRRPAAETMHGIGDAAFVHLALPALERRVARHRPAPRVVVVRGGAADLVDAGPQLAAPGGRAVHQPTVVDRSLRSAFGARTVVGDRDDHGVVEVAGVGEELEQPGDLRVGVREVRGEALHEARRDRAVFGLQRVPRRNPVRARRELRVRGQHAARDLAGERRRRATRPIRRRSDRGSARSIPCGAWWGEWHAPVAK